MKGWVSVHGNIMNLEKTNLVNVIRNTNFGTLTNNIIPASDENVTSVSVYPDIFDSGITIISNLSTITVFGSYDDQFYDQGKYVSRGSSNRIEEPTIFNSLSNLPSNEDLYEYIQDPTPEITITYSVVIMYDITSLPMQQGLIYEGSFTHTILNDTTTGLQVVGNYYK